MKLDFLKEFEFFTGVPDSQLNKFCDYLMFTYGISNQHVIAANEGNCIGLAAGYHLATGKVPVVYLQNSGIGNIINPLVSLMNGKVYGIPCLFIIGWRGEPGIQDEPQHIFQGEITLRLLEDIGISAFVLDAQTTEEEIQKKMSEYRLLLAAGKQVAFVVRKNAFSFDKKGKYENTYSLLREEVIRRIAEVAGEDVVVSTTGKASRELFEIRKDKGQSHGQDFLTVGSMGHSSSIALGIALEKQDRRVWCIDGDGAALMHMGAMAVIGANAPPNLIHVVINNEAHESVGGAPTVAGKINFEKIAQGCGYKKIASVSSMDELKKTLEECKCVRELVFVEVKCAVGSREVLGRPAITPQKNKEAFMKNLQRGL